MIETLKATYATFQDDSESDFDKVLKLREELMEKHAPECKPLSKFHEFVVTTTLEKTAVKSNDDLRALWNCVLDRQITELSCRFIEDAYGIMRVLASIIIVAREHV